MLETPFLGTAFPELKRGSGTPRSADPEAEQPSDTPNDIMIIILMILIIIMIIIIIVVIMRLCLLLLLLSLFSLISRPPRPSSRTRTSTATVGAVSIRTAAEAGTITKLDYTIRYYNLLYYTILSLPIVY